MEWWTVRIGLTKLIRWDWGDDMATWPTGWMNLTDATELANAKWPIDCVYFVGCWPKPQAYN
jgi:hypothetical protein